ncbi:hypothetical protein ACJMK2_010215 [Sinanodonta woodiana]|uniref:FAM69 N-terminal domain-containing protein n=2 Tax=Sinanodonta woodiana TaxID=1069815 RepID=A0ABD3VEM1_SINWO
MWLRCRPRRCIRICCLMIVFFILVGGISIYHMIQKKLCSIEESKNLLLDLCKGYAQGQVTGNICDALCRETGIHFETCNNYRGGKKVMIVHCGVCQHAQLVRAVLKGQKHNFSENEQLFFNRMDDKQAVKNMVETTEGLLRNSILFTFGINVTYNTKVLSQLWFSDFDEYVDQLNRPDASWVTIQSIWSLAMQDEYLFMKLHQNFQFVPKLYGSCGMFYLTEFTPPGDNLNSMIYKPPSDWYVRANIALQILEMLRSIETNLHEPLHLCDIKGENFGIGSDDRVVLVDTDSVFFNSKLMNEIYNINCSTHEDCDYFDCRGWCHARTGRCLHKRMNNNLQSVCEEIFLGYFPGYLPGLLHSPPENIKQELTDAIYECAFPDGDRSQKVRVPASQKSFLKIYIVLQKSINYNYISRLLEQKLENRLESL